jgi:Domain of unknown function (DUF4349)
VLKILNYSKKLIPKIMKTKFFIPLAGLVLFCACKGKNNYEIKSSSADSLAKDMADTTQAKLVKTAAIDFKVKNVQQTASKVTVLTEGFGGMVTHQQIGASPERTQDVRVSRDSVLRVISFSTAADITVKVPSIKLERFMDSVATMGIYVTSRNLDISDKSLDYLSLRLKLKSRVELVDRQKRGKVIIKDPSKVLDLQDDMVDQQIGNRQIDEAVKNSVVTLHFYQSNTINKELIANDDPSAYNLPFFKRLGLAIENGVDIFADVVIGLANIWLFILLAIGIWMMIRYYKNKKAANTVKVG